MGRQAAAPGWPKAIIRITEVHQFCGATEDRLEKVSVGGLHARSNKFSGAKTARPGSCAPWPGARAGQEPGNCDEKMRAARTQSAKPAGRRRKAGHRIGCMCNPGAY